MIARVSVQPHDRDILREVEAIAVLAEGEDEVPIRRERGHLTPPQRTVAPRNLHQLDGLVVCRRTPRLCPVDVVREEIRSLVRARRIVEGVTVGGVRSGPQVDGDLDGGVVATHAGRRVHHRDPLTDDVAAEHLTRQDRDASRVERVEVAHRRRGRRRTRVRGSGRAGRLNRARRGGPEDLTVDRPELEHLLGRLVGRVLVQTRHEAVRSGVVRLVPIDREVRQEPAIRGKGVDGRLPEIGPRDVGQLNRREVRRGPTAGELVVREQVGAITRGGNVVLPRNRATEHDSELDAVVVLVDLTEIGHVSEPIADHRRVIARVLKLHGLVPTLQVREVRARAGDHRRRVGSRQRTRRLRLTGSRIAHERVVGGDPELEAVGPVGDLHVRRVLRLPLVEDGLGVVTLNVVAEQNEQEAATSREGRHRDLPDLRTADRVGQLVRHGDGLVVRLGTT